MDNVSQITECSSQRETRHDPTVGILFDVAAAARSDTADAPMPNATTAFHRFSRVENRRAASPHPLECWEVRYAQDSLKRKERKVDESSTSVSAGRTLKSIITTDSDEVNDGSEQKEGRGSFHDVFRSLWTPTTMTAHASRDEETSHDIDDLTAPPRNSRPASPMTLQRQLLDLHGTVSAMQAEIRGVRSKNTALEGEIHAMRVRVAIAEEKIYRLEQSLRVRG
jgi:hypothetical protein